MTLTYWPFSICTRFSWSLLVPALTCLAVSLWHEQEHGRCSPSWVDLQRDAWSGRPAVFTDCKLVRWQLSTPCEQRGHFSVFTSALHHSLTPTHLWVCGKCLCSRGCKIMSLQPRWFIYSTCAQWVCVEVSRTRSRWVVTGWPPSSAHPPYGTE